MNFNIYPNPWDLRYFQEIASTGNLSRASERLGVGQPALSLALKRLEEGLEVELFLRRNRGLTLTSAGQRLLRESNKLQAAWESVVGETKKSETELVGRYTLGCHPSVAIYALKDVIRDLYASYSGIEVQLIHALSRVVCEGVISGTLDFGIVVNPIKHPDLVIHKLATDEVCFWKTHKGHEDVLIYNPALSQSQALIQKIKKKEPFKRTICSDNLEVIASLASNGAGVAILPTRVAKAIASNLKQVEGYPTYYDEVTFLYRADLPKTSSSKCVVNYFKVLKI
ncbi:MAG: LysR family transcriptional regulator [Bdellovibrionales bacterium]